LRGLAHNHNTTDFRDRAIRPAGKQEEKQDGGHSI